MIRKISLALGFGAGYVLGAKAGTQRYEQIVAKAREIAGMPAVQEVTGSLSQTASAAAATAKSTVNEKVTAVNDKVSGAGSTGTPGVPVGGESPLVSPAAPVPPPPVPPTTTGTTTTTSSTLPPAPLPTTSTPQAGLPSTGTTEVVDLTTGATTSPLGSGPVSGARESDTL